MTEPHLHQEPANDAATSEMGAGSASASSVIESLKTDVTNLKDQLLRALAEVENTRRRAAKEREETAKYAVTNFAKDMLNVADNFVRAVEAAPKNTSDDAVKNLVTGVDATERQLQGILERFGISKMEPLLGQPFDPNFHRAMLEVDDPLVTPGTIVQVLQAGYMIHDRLLREALVAVAKGGAAVAPKIDTSA